MYAQIIAGVIAGVGYAIVGWQKNKQERDFEWFHLGKDALIGAVVGGIAGYTNADFSVLLTGTTGIGVTKIVDLVIGFFKK